MKPALLEVSFRMDIRADKIETRVIFPALFNVGTGMKGSVSNQKRQTIYAQNIAEAHSRKTFFAVEKQ